MIERIEVHYLSNQDGDITYALLSDWPDSATEQADGDDALLARAKAGISRLNRRYGRGIAGERFLLLHRRRQWNASQQKWMGWERKRGKLEELNRLLRGADDTSFIAIDGQAPAVPRDVRYVVTLDSDTRMPRETIRRLVGKMAHVLNRPRLDPRLGRVVQGYGIMQPRVTAALPVGSEGSWFQRLFASSAGIDPYAGAISDVYQDLFDEGIYQGKGIYDVDAFSAALDGRTPESSILSHDLFEGIFARAGLASDVEFVEEFPERYDVFDGAPAPLGARRLATASLDLRAPAANGGRRDGARPLEDVRQSPPQPVAAGDSARAAGGLCPATRGGAALDAVPARRADRPERAAGIFRALRRSAAEHALRSTSAASAGSSGSRSFRPACSSRSSPIRRC